MEVCGCCCVLLLFLLIHGLYKFNVNLSSYQTEQKIFELQLIVFTPFERLYLFFMLFLSFYGTIGAALYKQKHIFPYSFGGFFSFGKLNN